GLAGLMGPGSTAGSGWQFGPGWQDPGAGAAGQRRERRRQRPPVESDEPSLLDALDTFGADLPGDPDERYTPPPPPPLPSVSKYTIAGAVAMVVGFVLFLFPDLLPVLGDDVVMIFGFTSVLAGFVTLIWRMRPGTEDEDDDPDDGAVV
ncbi:MAG TPA: DUF308 domain-containing protein, partial [Pilimelia sp.]|nr:DUF308 domain-containing protein [Pilimelia sp.]